MEAAKKELNMPDLGNKVRNKSVEKVLEGLLIARDEVPDADPVKVSCSRRGNEGRANLKRHVRDFQFCKMMCQRHIHSGELQLLGLPSVIGCCAT